MPYFLCIVHIWPLTLPRIQGIMIIFYFAKFSRNWVLFQPNPTYWEALMTKTYCASEEAYRRQWKIAWCLIQQMEQLSLIHI